MKLAMILLSVLAVLPSWAADEGDKAPAFKAKLLSGDTYSMGTPADQVVVLHFWATWCVPCRTEMPLFEAYYKAHHAEGLQMIAISMDKAEDESKAREIMKAFSFPAALAKDASFKGYGRIWRLPLTFVIDRKGILRKDGWALDHTLTNADFEQVITPLLKPSKL